jgi:hypothetical protein
MMHRHYQRRDTAGRLARRLTSLSGNRHTTFSTIIGTHVQRFPTTRANSQAGFKLDDRSLMPQIRERPESVVIHFATLHRAPMARCGIPWLPGLGCMLRSPFLKAGNIVHAQILRLYFGLIPYFCRCHDAQRGRWYGDDTATIRTLSGLRYTFS